MFFWWVWSRVFSRKSQPEHTAGSGGGTPSSLCSTDPCQGEADADYCCQPYAVWYDHAKSTLAVSGRNRQVTAGRKNFRRQSSGGFRQAMRSLCNLFLCCSSKWLRPETRCIRHNPKEFHVGERVRHAVFGDGTVLSITKMANDAMLEVGFDQVGTKRLMASHPKIKKLEE